MNKILKKCYRLFLCFVWIFHVNFWICDFKKIKHFFNNSEYEVRKMIFLLLNFRKFFWNNKKIFVEKYVKKK